MLLLMAQDQSAGESSHRHLTRSLQENAESNGLSESNVTIAREVSSEAISDAYQQAADQFLRDLQRLEAHITTDKVIYRPDDVMFVEVLLLDAFNKTPVALNETQLFFSNFFVLMEVFDPSNSQVHSVASLVFNSTASFTFKVPSQAVGGKYTIRASNPQVPATNRVVRVREELRDQLIVTTTFTQDTYFPGDTVNGILMVQTADGTPFQEELSFSLSVEFDFGLRVQQVDQTIPLQGQIAFSFEIPEETSQLVVPVVFNVQLQQLTQTHTATLIIGQPDEVHINFVHETSNFVFNLPNKVFFQAFTSPQRNNFVDFRNATLKGETRTVSVPTEESPNNQSNLAAPFLRFGNFTLLPEPEEDFEQFTVIDQTIETLHRGKGQFTFIPQPQYDYFLEIDLGGASEPIRRNITIDEFFAEQAEVTFTILNEDKVLAFDEDLEVVFHTNENVNPDDFYSIFVKQKERVVFNEVLHFDRNLDFLLVIPSSGFQIVNGGVLILSLSLFSRDFIIFARQAQTPPIEQLQEIIRQNPQDTNFLQNELFTPPPIQPPQPFLETPKGDILFFKEPSEILTLNITTDRQSYAPGDTVEFEVQVINQTTGQVMNESDAFVSVFVTDETVFSNIQQKDLPPSFPAMILLEKEIQKNNDVFFYANEYVNHIYSDQAVNSSDQNLHLLLSVQDWRSGLFFLNNIQSVQQGFGIRDQRDAPQVEQLFAQVSQGSQPFLQQPAFARQDEAFAIQQDFAPAEAFAPVAQLESAEADTVEQPVDQATVPEFEEDLQDAPLIQEDFMQDIPLNTRMFSHEVRENFTEGERIDMTETVFYATALRATQGVIRGSFELSDLITQFRITANAFDTTGKIGFQTTNFPSTLPFFIEFQLPASMVVGDQLTIPVTINNRLNRTLQASMEIVDISDSLNSTMLGELQEIEALSTVVREIVLEAESIDDQAFIIISVNATDNEGEQLQDVLTRTMPIIPQGFPRSQSQGGFIGTQLFEGLAPSQAEFRVSLPGSLEEGTFDFTATVFSSQLANIQSAIEALIGMPHLCMEQVGSIANSMALSMKFLQSLPQQSSDVQTELVETESRLAEFFQQLLSFQMEDGGFSWFGDGPSHVALSGMQLQVLTEIQRVSSVVNDQVVDDLRGWILSQRDQANGGFFQDPLASAIFGRAPQDIVDAYTVWTLTSTGVTDIENQINRLVELAQGENSEDPYFLALVSNSLFNVDRDSQANVFAERLVEFQEESGRVTGAVTSITSSLGTNLDIETTALSVLAWLNNPEQFMSNIRLGIEWIVSQVREGGAFGSTQATILSLRALTAYLEQFRGILGEGEFVLSVNGQEIERKQFTNETREALVFTIDDFIEEHEEDIFTPGSEVIFTLEVANFTPEAGLEQDIRLTYSMLAEFYDELPQTFDTFFNFQVNRTFAEEMQLGEEENTGQLFNYNLTLVNLQEDQRLGMTVAIFRVPSCLQIDFNLLEALSDQNLFDFFEVREQNTEIAIYWRSVEPEEVKTFNIGLVQRFSGECQEKPHSAFEYYVNDRKVWVTAA